MTQQADFGLSHKISPREILMLLGGFATSSHCNDGAVEVEDSMGYDVPAWVIVLNFSVMNFTSLRLYYINIGYNPGTRVTDARMEII